MALTAEQTVAIEDAQFNIDLAQQYIADSEASIATSQQNIAVAEADIESATAQLTNPNLSSSQRVYYEATIAADQQVIASNAANIQNQQDSIFSNTQTIRENQDLISSVSSATASTPGGTGFDPISAIAGRQVSLQDSLAPGESIVNNAANVPGVNLGTATGDDLVAAFDAGPAEDPFEASRQAAEDRYNNEAGPTEEAVQASIAAGIKLKAQQQQVLAARRNVGNNADWRFKIKLAPNANYLYAAPNPGILAPLKNKGVIFPYTPQVETQYSANYDKYDLIHSNYRGYFYKGSAVNEISVRGTFTAQDTLEAQYLLAVIHFFRSVTKMFYGKDPQAGTPPPLVYVSGYGPYQFNDHACVVSNFTYSLPTDVDYIRADSPNQIGVNLENRNTRSGGLGVSGPFMSIVNRLKNAKLFAGALPQVPDPNSVLQTVYNQNPSNATYVPTKMEINIQLLPVQTRSEVSQQFSLQGFANGQLLKGGFW